MLPVIFKRAGVVTPADPTHRKFDCGGLQKVQNVANTRGYRNFLIPEHGTEEVIAKAYSDVVNFCQNLALTEDIYSRMLRNNTLRCGTQFFDRRLKSLFIDRLLPETRTHIRQCLFSSLRLEYPTVVQQAESLGDSGRVARRPATTTPAIGVITEKRFHPRAKCCQLRLKVQTA